MSNQKPTINFGKFVDESYSTYLILRQKVSILFYETSILALNLFIHYIIEAKI
ncbi:hypothetical protein J2787_002157 [Chryseobacterium rhizosphaerae]|jgi:hypothetical protein|uniref:Uncharacterized protein n=1 Tax=Chryseobacterium rhizosphaerae TaxID=395937 RepID=A0AAE3YA86_9FLAO|nr:hypothetical protein [Chryseobacterium rhizosphaerae]MDR6544634.1 hypothetical protein [Chryseobacterium rhizosphaerae]SMC74402.1 hypothetical protein SAMN02787074_2792 [Chryseobacterium sp. YR221]